MKKQIVAFEILFASLFSGIIIRPWWRALQVSCFRLISSQFPQLLSSGRSHNRKFIFPPLMDGGDNVQSKIQIRLHWYNHEQKLCHFSPSFASFRRVTPAVRRIGGNISASLIFLPFIGKNLFSNFPSKRLFQPVQNLRWVWKTHHNRPLLTIRY